MIDVITDKYPTTYPLNQKIAPYVQNLRLQSQRLTGSATESASLIKRYQYSNGLIPATLGRYDDEYFKDQCWLRDAFLATQPAVDQTVRTYIPEVWQELSKIYLSSIFGLVQILTQPTEIHRFLTIPGFPEYDGYHSVNCHQIPLTKCSISGERTDWAHDQPDVLGIMLSNINKGVKIGLPILENTHDSNSVSTGETVILIAIQLAKLEVERLRCTPIWEQDRIQSPYSTRKFALSGLHQTLEVYDKIAQNSQKGDYKIINKRDLPAIERHILSAARKLEEKVLEHFPNDWTNLHHPYPGDLASFIILSNGLVNSGKEEEEILKYTAPLKRPLGYIRYQGDQWKYGSTEAWWTLGVPTEALYSFNQAYMYFSDNQPSVAFRFLHLGLQEMDKISLLKQIYGYIPELLTDKNHHGKIEPNNNELAWFHGLNIQACASGKAAIDTAEKYLHQRAA